MLRTGRIGIQLHPASSQISRGQPQLEVDSLGRVRFVPDSPFGLIVDALASRAGIEYEVVVADVYGSVVEEEDEDGEPTFDGIIGMVQRKV